MIALDPGDLITLLALTITFMALISQTWRLRDLKKEIHEHQIVDAKRSKIDDKAIEYWQQQYEQELRQAEKWHQAYLEECQRANALRGELFNKGDAAQL